MTLIVWYEYTSHLNMIRIIFFFYYRLRGALLEIWLCTILGVRVYVFCYMPIISIAVLLSDSSVSFDFSEFEFSPWKSHSAWSALDIFLFISIARALCTYPPSTFTSGVVVCDPLTETREHYRNDTQSNEMTLKVWCIVCAHILLKINLLEEF